MTRNALTGVAVTLATAWVASASFGQVFPNQPHAFYNVIPFGVDICTYQQVYAAAQFGSTPVQINSIAFALDPSFNGQQVTYSNVAIRFGYTDRSPGGLSVTLSDNPRGSLTEAFSVAQKTVTINSGGSEDFSLVFQMDTPFCYDPLEGNMLIEIAVTNTGPYVGTSRCAGVPDASRAYNSTRLGNGADNVAQRIKFELSSCSTGPRLQLSGDCPGRITVQWSNTAPNSNMGILFARNTGSFVVPGGPCAGTQLGLGSNQLQLVNTVNTGNGSGSVGGNAGTGACGGYIQLAIVDGNPCSTSNVVQLP